MNEVINMGAGVTGGVDGPASVFVAVKPDMGTMIVAVIIGLLICFLGLKLMRILTALAGFVLGVGTGLAIASVSGTEGAVFVGIVLGCGLVFALLSFFLYKVGVFFVALCGSMGILTMLFRMPGTLLLVIMLVVSVILAILAVVFVEPVIIVLTAVSGGLTAGTMIVEIAGISSMGWPGYAIGAAAAVLGMIVQFTLHSKKIKHKEQKHAEEIRETASMESEVEKARNIFADDDEEE